MRILPVLLCLGLLAGCGSSNDTDRYLDTGTSVISGTSGRLTLGVNTYLWRATLDTLSTLSQVFATGEDGAPLATPAIPRSAVGLRVEFDKRSLQVAQAFLARLAPLEGHVRALSGAVDGVAGACAAALARARSVRGEPPCGGEARRSPPVRNPAGNGRRRRWHSRAVSDRSPLP